MAFKPLFMIKMLLIKISNKISKLYNNNNISYNYYNNKNIFNNNNRHPGLN